MKFYPYEKGGAKKFSNAEGGGRKKFSGSFSHIVGGPRKVSTL